MLKSQSIALIGFVGSMKVEAFARLAGLDVQRLVARLLEDGRAQGSAARAVPRSVAVVDGALLELAAVPALASMIDRGTHREIHAAVDRWYVVSVMNEERANVSRAARRLRISRRRLRVLWAASSATAHEDVAHESTPPGRRSDAPPPPSLEPLLAAGTHRQVHDAVDRWLLAHAMAKAGGNVSHAARELGLSRTYLRNRLVRLKLGDVVRSPCDGLQEDAAASASERA
jgi:DNA-binding NtrC family response regulator